MAQIVFDGDASKYPANDPILNLSPEKRAFIEEVAYCANQEYSKRKAAGQDWVLPSVCISQACLESGYGQYTTVNIFGIKGSGTVAKTSEYGSGGYYGTNASFISHGTIADDVKVYYDLICGTGNYEGFDIYSAARNNTDPADAIAKIRQAGYATSPTYIENVTSVLNNYNLRQFDTGAFVDFKYNSAGYTEGTEIYENLNKVVVDLETNITNSETKIRNSCSNTPRIEYETIIEFEAIKKAVIEIKELLERTKAIADQEKYIAETYNVNNVSDDAFANIGAATLAASAANFSFNNLEDFKQMVNNYKSADSNMVFSEWFKGYVSEKGIESKVVNMSQYQKAIKETGSAVAADYVVSKASYILASEEKEEVKDESSKENSTGSSTGGSSGGYQSGGYSPGYSGRSSSSTFVSNPTQPRQKEEIKQEVVEEVQEVKAEEIIQPKETEEVKKETPVVGEATVVDNIKAEEIVKSEDVKKEESSNTQPTTTTPTAPKPVEATPISKEYQQPPVVNNNDGVVNDIPNNQTPLPTAPVVDNPQDQDMVTPLEEIDQTGDTPISPPTTVIPLPTGSTTAQKESNIGGIVATGLGIGAAAAAIGGGAYYMKKKSEEEKEEEQEEYEVEDNYQEEVNDDIDPFAQVEPYEASAVDEKFD